MSGITGNPGTTLFVCAWPIYPAIDYSVKTDEKIIYLPQTLSAMQKLYMSALSRAVEHQAQKAITSLLERMTAFNKILSENIRNSSGNVVFWADLTVLADADQKTSFPETVMIPWYMLSLNREYARQSYKQPELYNLCEGLEMSSPQIENLDRLLEDCD